MNITSVILISVCAFLLLTLILVGLLLYAKAKIAPGGTVQLRINGEQTFTVSPGSSIIATLSDHKIFLPSACGGGGTCGMCKCRVTLGGGQILPTETGFFSRKQQQNQWRLGCQVKVREDLEIVIPKEVLGVKKWVCEVVSNRNVATFIKEFVVKLPEGEVLNFKSGGYVQIDVPKCSVNFQQEIEVAPEYRDDWDKMKIWDLCMKNPKPTFRAYSMVNHPAEGNTVMLNIRIATPPWDRAKGGFMKVNPGICSSYLFSRKPGDKVTVSGPYGEFFLRDTQNEMLFVGGGAGMAPMRSHLFHLFHTLQTTRKVSFWYGARSKGEIFYEEEFRAIEKAFSNFIFTISLSEPLPSDKWSGPVGFIHNVIYDNYLKTHEAPEDVEYYLCGPPLMTNAVTEMLDNLGVAAENVMFDDFGT